MGARRNLGNSKSWLIERKEILQKIKDQVRLYLGDESSDVTLYAQAYKRDIARSWKVSQWSELEACLQQVSVVFGGDFHPFAQAQRAHLRILRKLVGERQLVLGLECLFADDQKIVDDYLAGKIDEEKLYDLVNWEQSWGFPYAHYKPLLQFARDHKVPVVALNVSVDERSGRTLHQRDEAAARLIHQSYSRYPEALHYVVYGDLHIAEQNLPQALQRIAGDASIETSTLYLNSEQIFFQLMEQKKETEVEMVAFNDRHFCLLSSPPWVKWQSYLMYLEENFDVDLDAEEEDWDFVVDYTDHVYNLVKMLGTALELDINAGAIEVYSLRDEQALRNAEKTLNTEDRKLAHSLVQSDRSFYIPDQGYFYLSKATVNHAAHLAGKYVHGQLCNRNQVLWDFPNDFLRTIWIESMAFLLSKLINPKRKAQKMADLKKQLQAFDQADRGREPLLLALDQKMAELLRIYASSERPQVYRPSERSSYIHAAKFIGEMLGERYFVLYQKQIIDKDKVLTLLSQKLSAPDFETFYYEQIKMLDRLEGEAESKA